MTPSDEKNFAMLCHLSALAGLFIPFGNLIGPLIFWLLKKDQSVLVDANGKESLNFQITMLIAMFVSILLCFILIGIPLAIAVGLLSLIMPIIAAVKAGGGEIYRYPLTIRFLQ